jgi:CMP-N-acetylneuraminic acid synthetase
VSGSTGNVVALIPARGGSQRIHDKNIAPFLGHPLMAHTIAAARASERFAAVVVSTDSPRYVAVARHYGASAILRPPELATDTADLVGVTLHALASLREGGLDPEIVCLLMPCCPLRRSVHIQQHFEIFERLDRRFQISVVRYRGVYPEWAMSRDPEGRIAAYWGEDYFRRSQELPELVCPSGALWVARTADFRAQRTFYGSPLHGEILPDPAGIDIDEPEDLELALALAHGYAHVHRQPQTEPISGEPWSEP